MIPLQRLDRLPAPVLVLHQRCPVVLTGRFSFVVINFVVIEAEDAGYLNRNKVVPEPPGVGKFIGLV